MKERKTKRFLIIGLVFLVTYDTVAAITDCHPLLWPNTNLNKSLSSLSLNTRDELIQWSEKLIHKPTSPVAILKSSGKTDINDSDLIASRKGFKDADRAAVLAITYRLTHNLSYLSKTREILLSWATMNHPTGNPIDETRLAGMLWAYDLVSCNLPKEDKIVILNWFTLLHEKKMSWKFGSITTANNHRIHQIKMLLLLDKILARNKDWSDHIEIAETYSKINLNPQSGVSVDYIERHALYYHNYVTQAWLEISLISNCCQKPVTRAFDFLSNKILRHQIGGEFLNSKAKIDSLRAKGNFVYAQKGGTFDLTKAAPTILAYYTLIKVKPEPKLWSMQHHTSSPWIIFLKARRLLWQPSAT